MPNTTPAPIGADAWDDEKIDLLAWCILWRGRYPALKDGVPWGGELRLFARELVRAAIASAAQPADPVTVEAVAKVVRHDEGIGLDWLIEGGISALAVGEVLVCANAAVTDDTGSGEVYLAPAAAAPKAAPAQSEWPLLEHEAALHEDGTARFGPGVSAKLLVEAAYRNAERTKERQQMTGKQRQEEERKRRALWDMVHGAPAELPEWWNKFIQGVCEIADRSSPEDEPDAIVATPDELAACALNAIENDRASRGQAPAPTTQAAPQQQQELVAEIQRLQRALAFWLPQVPSEDHPLQDRIAHDAFLLAGYSGPDEPSANELGHVALTTAPAPSAQEDASPTMPKDIEMMAANRYRPVPSGVLAYKVVGGDGNRSLFSGTKDECQIVARKLTEAFLDGAHVALSTQPAAPSAQGDALDTARIDYLASLSEASITRVRYVGAEKTIYEVAPINDDSYDGDTLREAIDAARAAKEGASNAS